jgi:K+/H+ antiporter YhaU regulatory subunit KhtT
VNWLSLEETSPLAGRTIASSRLRTRTGASIVAISRDDGLVPNPEPNAMLQAGDRVAVIGTSHQIESAAKAMSKES